MPRVLNISAVEDDDDNSYETDSVLTDQNEPVPSGSSICPSTKADGARDARPYSTASKTERHNKKQHQLFLQICHNKGSSGSAHRHHKKDKDAPAAATEADTADADAELLRFGVGTYGETEQEQLRERTRQKEPRYGRKKLVEPTLRRRESVYDRLRRSSSFAQQAEGGQDNSGARSLTNERVAQRSAKRTADQQRSVQEAQAQPATGENGATPSLPPILAAREEKGGVLDAYGYFSTHRVNPYYYRELDQQHLGNNNINNNNTSNNSSNTPNPKNNRTNTSSAGYAHSYKSSVSSTTETAAPAVESSKKSSRRSSRTKRRSFLGGKVDAATGVADSEHQLYATKRYEDERTSKAAGIKPYKNVYSSDNRRETRKESLYGQCAPAVKAA